MPAHRPRVLTCAASSLVADVLPDAASWSEAVRTSVSVHYETGDPAVPVVCVATPAAVLLPYAVVVPVLPRDVVSLRVTRWWSPPRPTGLAAPEASRWSPWARSVGHDLRPMDLVGRGEGLTPAGDDVLAGALVAAHAIGDPRLHDWRGATRAALAGRRTTAVSVGMLHAALDGWSSPALADGLTALCGPDDPGPALERLLAVGHSSGRHLLDGVVHVLSTHLRGVAA